MATVFQPPFWVPRPYDGPVWNGTAPPQSLILPLLTSVGQTKPRWPWHFELNDPPPWSGSPLASDVLAVLLTAGGKIKPRLPWQFGLDAPDPWKWTPPNLALTEAIISRPFVNPPLNFWRDDAPVWSGSPIDSAVLGQLLTAAGQTKPRWPWHFEQDDAPVWLGKPLASDLLAPLLTAQGQTNPRWSWHFEQDDAPVWQGKPLASDLLAPLLTASGQVKPRVPWNFGFNSPDPWQWSPPDLALTKATSGAAPSFNPPWLFGRDDAAVWSGKPLANQLLSSQFVAQDPMKSRWMWDFDLDTPNPWQWSPPNLTLTKVAAAPAPSFNAPWLFGRDDAAVWSGSPIDSAILGQLLTSQGQTKPRWPWHFELIDPPVWSGSPIASRALEVQFDIGESAFWVPRPYDGPVWIGLAASSFALIKSTPAAAPSFNPPLAFWRDDAAVWAGGPIDSPVLGQLLTAQGQTKSRWPWHFEQDDAAFWQGKPLASDLLAPLLTTQGQTKPRIPWNWGQNEPPTWYGQPLPNQERNLILLTTVIGTPFLNPPWVFGQDHQSVFWGSPLPVYRVNLSLANPGPPVTAIGNEWLIRARRRGRR